MFYFRIVPKRTITTVLLSTMIAMATISCAAPPPNTSAPMVTPSVSQSTSTLKISSVYAFDTDIPVEEQFNKVLDVLQNATKERLQSFGQIYDMKDGSERGSLVTQEDVSTWSTDLGLSDEIIFVVRSKFTIEDSPLVYVEESDRAFLFMNIPVIYNIALNHPNTPGFDLVAKTIDSCGKKVVCVDPMVIGPSGPKINVTEWGSNPIRILITPATAP